MTNKIGRLHGLWLARETVRGTAMTTGGFNIPWTSLTFQPDVTYTNVEGAHGIINDSTDAIITRKMQNISFDFDGYSNILYHVFRATFGDVTTAPATTHTYTPVQTNTHDTYTIGMKGLDADRSAAFCALNSLTLTQDNEGHLQVSTDWMGKLESASTVPANSFNATARPYTQGQMTFKNATDFAGLGAASGVCVRNASIEINKNVEPEFCTSSADPVNFFNQQFTVTGSATLVWNTTDVQFRGYTTAGTKRAVQLSWTDGSIVTSISLHSATFEAWEPQFETNSIVSQNISFTGHYSLTGSQEITAVITGLTV